MTAPVRRIARGLAAALAAAVVNGPALASAAPGVAIADQGGRGIVLEISIPSAAVDVGVDRDGFRTVAIERLPVETVPGMPEVPVLVVGFAIPEGAEVLVDRDLRDDLVVPGPPLRSVRPPGASDDVGFPAEAAEGASRAGGRPPVTLDEFRVRGLRVGRASIEIVRPDPDAASVAIHLRQTVRIRFAGGSGFASVAGGPLGETVTRALRGRLANAGSAFPPLAAPPSPAIRDGAAASPAVASFAAANPGVRVRVDGTGLVRITRAELEAIGFDPAPVNPRNLEVYHRGVPVPCRVTGEADASFDAGDVVEFYGVPADTRYARENVYWLEEQSGPGLRFPAADASPGSAPVASSFPETFRFEDGNTIYTYGKPATEGEPRFFWVWFEDSPSPPRTTSFSHVAELVDLDPAGSGATFRALFLGRTDTAANPDHTVRLSVNGTAIGTSAWNGMEWNLAAADFATSLLAPGANTFRIDYVPVSFPDIYYMDWYEIVYPRRTRAIADRLTVVRAAATPTRFEIDDVAGVSDPVVLDVTDPMFPVALTGWTVSGAGPYRIAFEPRAGERFLVAGDGGRLAAAALELDEPSALRDPARAADLLIVVPAGWEDALSPLVDHRRGQGLRVVLASLRDVADEFAGGNVDDVAVRDAVRHAYDEWQPPALSYVLLVGEANRDPRNFLAQTPHHYYLPTHHGVTAALGETTTETWFGAVSGADLVPDVAVGRLSVRSAAEAAEAVAKIVAYETGANGAGPWRDNVVLIASNEAQFEDALERAAARLPAHVTVDRQYRRSGATSASIDGAFEAGAALASFLGHGNVTLWADNPGGSFYDNDDVVALSNDGRLPFVTAFNCINGFIAHPTVIDSMEEVFAGRPTGGAIAAWSTSALGVLSEFDALQEKLYATVYEDHVPGIGDATLAALVGTYLEAPVSIDLVKKMILLGDPSGWLAVDTDGDAMLDRAELDFGLDPADRDSDDDGLLDGLEGEPGADDDGDGVVNGLDPDSDDDGLGDGLESGVAVPDADTDTTRGRFTADLDPGTTTDPRDPDTDGGGAPDGVEDRDGNGRVDAGETDPLAAADDVACALGPVPEIAASPDAFLRLTASGADLTLSWGDVAAEHPCVLYRVYAADGAEAAAGKAAFSVVAVTARPSVTIPLPASPDRRYVVVGATLAAGEGPWGHFE